MSANSVKGEVQLVLKDKRTFTLVLDHEALLGVEDTTGKPLPKVMSRAAEGFMTDAAAIAQAAFARHHPEITRADVLSILMGPEAATLNDALGRASKASFPAQEAEGNVPPKPARRGKTSGRSGAKQG